MDLGVRLQRKELVEKAVQIALQEVEYGWDKKHGGIFYFRIVWDIRYNNWNGIRSYGGFTSKH